VLTGRTCSGAWVTLAGGEELHVGAQGEGDRGACGGPDRG
jgi:hypothetical protein